MSFVRCENEGVVFYRSTLLRCPHAFSTRIGGVSTQAHLASMNLGNNRGDAPENVRENQRRFLHAASLPEKVVSARQIHSAAVLPVDEVPEEKPELDGFCTVVPGVTLCVKMADCLPVLLYDGQAHAVAALHAGWRGAAAGIVKSGIDAMIARGADPRRITAAIGQGIGKCCFAVREDFVREFTALAGKEAADRFILYGEKQPHADLKGFVKEKLLESGVPEEQIDVSPECTCCKPDLFFSHRASGGLRGTMGAFIALS